LQQVPSQGSRICLDRDVLTRQQRLHRARLLDQSCRHQAGHWISWHIRFLGAPEQPEPELELSVKMLMDSVRRPVDAMRGIDRNPRQWHQVDPGAAERAVRRRKEENGQKAEAGGRDADVVGQTEKVPEAEAAGDDGGDTAAADGGGGEEDDAEEGTDQQRRMLF
jgi:hypothetical protein